MTDKVLILGGTAEGRQLAERLKNRTIMLSLAGRTRAPLLPDVPVRIGGFGGVEGLAAYLRTERITALIDATHPYAAQMSRHAVEAARLEHVPLLQLRRPAWEMTADDLWFSCADTAAAAARLGDAPRRVFLALGRQELAPFTRLPQHHYVVRSVDPIGAEIALPNAYFITARGPFALEDEMALLREHDIECVVSKNSGGPASFGKITAARALHLPVFMIDRPPLPDALYVESVAAAVEWASRFFSQLYR